MQALAVEVAKGNLAPPDAGVFPSSSISDLSRLLPHDTFGMEAKTATKTAAKSMRSKSRSKQLHAMNQPEPDAESAKWMIHGMPSGVEVSIACVSCSALSGADGDGMPGATELRRSDVPRAAVVPRVRPSGGQCRGGCEAALHALLDQVRFCDGALSRYGFLHVAWCDVSHDFVTLCDGSHRVR
eukprot:3745711-Rhodomonas_salina.3